MYPHVCYAFVDGGYLRARAQEWGLDAPNPRNLAARLADSTQVQTMAFDPSRHPNALLGRVSYYDALPNDARETPDLEQYWKAIEVLPDVHLGFGALKGLKPKVRQKGVDVLMAVDMLVGAFSDLFDIALLLAGDADFVPAVEEVKRRGVMVVLAASKTSVADELLRASDRFIEITSSAFDPMRVDGKTFKP